MNNVNLPDGYSDWLSSIKKSVRQAQGRAAVAANSEMILVYWKIGVGILARQADAEWGAKVIERLASDLQREFPGARGFSTRNLKYMKAFAAAWPDPEFGQQVVAQIPWGSHTILLDKIVDTETRAWYAHQAIAHRWSRAVLVHQIETRLHERQGRALNNFARTMPPEDAALAEKAFKDPYVLDFVDLSERAHERHLEKALIERIKDFLLELGSGFSFVGSQHRLNVGGQDFYLDILFYHIKLHRYVVVELKLGEFEPEFAGKLNFYLTAVDEQLATEGDNASIGLLLCRGKNGLVVEYALREMGSPMAVSDYTVLPPNWSGVLPSPADIADRIGNLPVELGALGGRSPLAIGDDEHLRRKNLAQAIVALAETRSLDVPQGFAETLLIYGHGDSLQAMLDHFDGAEGDLEDLARQHGVDLPRYDT